MNLPQIRLRSSFLLNDAFLPLLLPELKKAGDGHVANTDFIEAKVVAYNAELKNYEKRILVAMCEALGVEFKQNTIDAYVLPLSYSFSDPMIISTKHGPERFIDIFTHELLHRLLSDNNKASPDYMEMRLDAYKDLFGSEHSFVTLVHIPVHATMEYVFTDLLDEPERIVRDIELCSKHPHYAAAWEYVHKNGYRQIVKQLRRMYTEL